MKVSPFLLRSYGVSLATLPHDLNQTCLQTPAVPRTHLLRSANYAVGWCAQWTKADPQHCLAASGSSTRHSSGGWSMRPSPENQGPAKAVPAATISVANIRP